MTRITRVLAARCNPKMIKRTKRGFYLLDGMKVYKPKERRQLSKDTCGPCGCRTCQNKACRARHGNQCLFCGPYPPVRGCHEREAVL